VKLKKWLKIEYLALIAYAILIGFLVYHHEPWRDEADTWLMVRECSLSQVLHLMPYAGTPSLWYLMLWPLAKLGLPYITINVVSGMFGIAAVAVLLVYSPFGLITNSLIAFSYLFSYEYPIVARSYQVSIFLIFSMAACHHIRFSRPLIYSSAIALLANTNVHSLLIALCLSFAYAISLLKNKLPMVSIAKGLLPAGIGILLAVLQLIQPADGQGIRKECQYKLEYTHLTVREAFVPQVSSIDHGGTREELGDPPSRQAVGFIAVLAVLGVLVRIRKSPWAISSLVLSWTGLLALFVLVYGGSLRHWGFFVVMTIYALWVALQEAKSSTLDTRLSRIDVCDFLLTRAAFATILSLSLVTAVTAWVKDTHEQFSGGKTAAQFIEAEALNKFPIVSYPMSLAKPVLPYLPKGSKLFYPHEGRFGSYGKWDTKTYNYISERKLLRRLNRRFGENSKIVLIVAGTPLKNSSRSEFRLAYRTPRTLTTDERYYIYIREAGRQTHSDHLQSARKASALAVR
jgi:hypothetical protein